MYFCYLNLPEIPQDFFYDCLEKTKLIGIDPRINALNEHRGPMNRATVLPDNLLEWLKDNITTALYSDNNDQKPSALLNVTIYQKFWKRQETWGTHPKHIDVGRNWALNYYFTTGGTDTRIMWHKEDQIVAEAGPILPTRWCLLKTDIHHSVKHIEPDQTRYFVSVDVETDSIPLLQKFINSDTVI